MGDLAVDDWEQLAEELVQETAGDQFGGIDNHFGGMRKAPSQDHLHQGSQMVSPPAHHNTQVDEAEHRQLDEEISRLRLQVAAVEGELGQAREELVQEEQMYDVYQEKCAELRLQQQGWDQGVMDLLSKWQGWTDTVERSEAVHFEEESVLMAQLISHQQQMTEVLGGLPSELTAATEAPKQQMNSVWGSEAPFNSGDQLNSFELPGGEGAGVWSHNKVASSWYATQTIGGDVSGNSSSWGDVGGAVGGSSGGGSAWGGSSGVQAGPPGMQISKGHLGHQIGGSGWGSAAPQPQENNSRNSVWDGPVQTNNTWATGSGNNQQGGVPQPVWGAGGMGGGMW